MFCLKYPDGKYCSWGLHPVLSVCTICSINNYFLMVVICIELFHKRIYVMTEVSVPFDRRVADVGTVLLGSSTFLLSSFRFPIVLFLAFILQQF